MDDNAIEVNGITRTFKTYVSGKGLLGFFRRKYSIKKALDNVSFSVKKGEIVALLGKNGSGKSTLIKTMIGVLYPNSGNATVLGLDPYSNRKTIARDIGVVMGAHGQLYTDLPALGTFELMRYVYNIPKHEFRKRLNFFIKKLDLEKVYTQQVRTLSFGERMKCNFVASILHMPKIVILDEPTVGVDISSKAALKDMIKDMQKRYNTTFFITTHVVEDLDIAERIIMLDEGRKIFDGTSDELLKYFGEKRIIELHFRNDIKKSDYRKYGKVVESESNYIKLEIGKEMLRKKSFTAMISDPNIIDYSVAEEELNNVILALYKMNKKK